MQAHFNALDSENTLLAPNGKYVGVSSLDEVELEDENVTVVSDNDSIVEAPIQEMLAEPKEPVFFMLDGKKVFKISAVKAYFGGEKLSVDRLKRVKGYSRFDNRSDSKSLQTLVSSSDDDKNLVLRDPFVCILKVVDLRRADSSVCCLVVGVVEDIKVDAHSRYSISVSDSDFEKAVVTARALPLTMSTKLKVWW